MGADWGMPLEPTNDEAFALAGYLATATTIGETRAMHVVMMLWPHIRDMVLEAAARECELPQAQDDWVPEIAQQCARDIRAMKGTP